MNNPGWPVSSESSLDLRESQATVAHAANKLLIFKLGWHFGNITGLAFTEKSDSA